MRAFKKLFSNYPVKSLPVKLLRSNGTSRNHGAGTLLFLIALALFTYLHFSLSLPDPDAFYHAKMAVLIKEDGLVKNFPWLQFTVLKDSYADHHFLYHILLVPFVVWLDPLIGLKVTAVIFSTLAVIIFYWLLRKLKIKFAFLYGLLILVINPFVFRISLGKAQPLSLIILFLGLYALCKRHHWALFFLSFFYVWTHGSWPLILIMAMAYVFFDFILSRCHFRKTSLKVLFSVFSGVSAGLVFNPYFPANLKFYFHQIVEISLINFQKVIGVGGEWYPYAPADLIANISLVFIVFIPAIVLFSIFIKRQSAFSWTSLFLAVAFFILTLKSRRYIEYLVPLAILFSAIAIDCALYLGLPKLYHSRKINNCWLWFKDKIYGRVNRKILFKTIMIYFFLAGAFIVARDMVTLKTDFQKGFALNKFQKAGTWLLQNTPKKSIVFHSDWDDFPMLFYHNSHNYYIVGLDPTFMYEYDKGLHKKWVSITTGEQKENLYQSIKNDFQASYIFIGKDHLAMNSNIREVGNFKLVYADDEAWVYKVE